MACSVQDFHDLVRLLEQHREWQAELCRPILTQEGLRPPELVQRLAEAHARAEERLAGVGMLSTRGELVEAPVIES